MVSALIVLFASVASAQVPSDVVLVAGDPDAVSGYLDTGATWVGSPWLSGTGPVLASFTDLVVDSAGDSYASFDSSLDVWHYDTTTSAWVSVATIPGSTATHRIVSVETIWDDHLMVVEATSRTIYEVDPVLGTVVSLATLSTVNGALDTITNYQLVGSNGHATVGSLGTFSLVEYNFATDVETVLHTLPGEPSALHNFSRPRRSRFISIVGSPNDTLYAYDDATVLWTATLSGNVVDLDQAWDGALWGLYDDGTIWRIDGLDGGEFDATALIASGLPANASTLFSGATTAADVCRNNPHRFVAGPCGCDYIEVDVPPSGLACRHWTAEFGTGITFADGVTLETGTVIGDNVTFGTGVLVGVGASVGDDATLGNDVIVGRSAVVGANVTLEQDVILGRSSEVSAGTVEASGVLGYQSRFDAGVLGGGAVLSTGVQLDGTWSIGLTGAGAMPVIGRDTHLVGGGTLERGVVVGPDVSSTGALTIQAGSRVRKDVVFGSGDVIGAGVRVGRDSTIGDSVEVRTNSQLRANVVLGPNQCLVAGTVVARGQTLTGQTCP